MVDSKAARRKKRLPKGFAEALEAYFRLGPKGRETFATLFQLGGDLTSLLLMWDYTVPPSIIAMEMPTERDRYRQAQEVAMELAEYEAR